MDVKLWWFALQKPVKENDKRVWDSFDVIAKWLISTRATVTQLTLMAGVIAGLLALRDGFFNFPLWLAMTLGIYFAHSSENLVNDYIDYTRGIDEDNYYRGQYGIHPLVHKFWTKQEWARWFFTAGFIAVLCGLFVLVYTGFSPIVIGLFLFGAAILPTYAWPLKYWGLGELLIYVNWGMVLIPGIYAILAGGIPSNLPNIIMAGMAFGFGFGSFNFGKHIDKIEADKKKGVGSLPVRLGESTARMFNIFTVILSYALVLYLVFVARFFSPTVLLVFLAAGRGWRVIKLLNQPRPKEAPPGFALWPRWFSTPQLLHIRLFGGLYILGIILDILLRMNMPGFWQ
ncbi:MAG TPA: prenyltransferase [Anaerolineales bacterium]|nr:prenyltransferase [Anaerolineales bacterium]